jgi:hypothetical protein
VKKRPSLAIAAALVAVASVLLLSSSAPPQALAVEAGVNCETYADGVCVVEVGDAWFCDAAFAGMVCPSSVVAGETVRWQYPASGGSMHTTTDCGDSCDTPTQSPLWDSGTLNPGDSFQFTFETPGMYNYYCEIHPFQQGIIRVLEPDATLGDVDCSSAINSIDAALVLQFGAALLASLPCAQNADTSGDGQTNAIDASLILQYSAGLIDGF